MPVLSGLRQLMACKPCGCRSVMLDCGLYELLPLKSDLVTGWVVMRLFSEAALWLADVESVLTVDCAQCVLISMLIMVDSWLPAHICI